MELNTLAKKPQLIKVSVDNPVVVKAYGESVDFWMWDRQELPTYLKLAQIKDNHEQLFEILKDLVLDSAGKPILGDNLLPPDIMVPVIEAAVAHLGNVKPQTSPA